MKKMLVYFKEYKKECVLAPLFKLLEASFELMIPLVVAAIIDQGIGQGNIKYVYRMGGIMVALGALGLLVAISAQYFAAKAAVGVAANVRSALFEHIHKLSYTEVDTIGTSTLITRLTSDVNQVQSGVNMTLRLLLRSPFIVFGAMIMAFTVDVKVALVFAGVIPLLGAIVFFNMKATIPMYRQVQKRLDKVLSLARENLTGMRVIRAFHKEEEEVEAFEKEHGRLTEEQVQVGKVAGLLNPLTYVFINLGLILLIYVGAVQVGAGVLTQGQVVALVNYISQILVELVKLANLIILIAKALASANRISDMMSVESSLPDEGTAMVAEEEETPILEFENVDFCYAEAGEESLAGIDFCIWKGETVGVIGGTGSGKTSFVNLIPRFYDATRGTIRFHGKPIAEYPVEEVRNRMGIVPQKAVLFQGTIESNLRWGNAQATEAELWDALAAAQAKEFVESREEGMKAPVSQGGKNFSGGQRQRLTIARALVRKPEILILDDSTSALDYLTDAKLRGELKKRKDTMTTIIVSQRTSSIQHADKILVLDDGKIAGLGTHGELLEDCEIYREIYDSQYQMPQAKEGEHE